MKLILILLTLACASVHAASNRILIINHPEMVLLINRILTSMATPPELAHAKRVADLWEAATNVAATQTPIHNVHGQISSGMFDQSWYRMEKRAAYGQRVTVQWVDMLNDLGYPFKSGRVVDTDQVLYLIVEFRGKL